MTKREWVAMFNPDAVLWDGLDDAVIGMTENGNVVYDVTKIHVILMSQGMTLDEAIEFHEYNISCTYVGEFTPVHITLID
jgi:hypothetical protein